MLNRIMLPLTVALLVIVVGGLWQMLDRPLERFVVKGDLTKLEQQSVEQLLLREQLDGILSTDLAAVTAALGELQWAREVTVRRVWPDALEVVLSRERPVARWLDEQYISASGNLLKLPDEYAGLPQFQVEVSTPEQAMEVYRLVAQMASRIELQINTLAQNAQGEWRVQFSSGPELLLGAERLSDRMHRFVTLHRQVLTEHEQQASYVDARYTNGVAVKFAEAETDDNPDNLLIAKRVRAKNYRKDTINGG
jgi:cell division protein FtsQ